MSQGCGEGQMRHPLGPGVQGLPVAGPEVGGTELLTGPLKCGLCTYTPVFTVAPVPTDKDESSPVSPRA